MGASKWTRSLPIGPETTCIGPVLSSRQAPALICCMPLRPVGNRERMPGKQPLVGERLIVVARGVEHHFDDALDIAVCWLERPMSSPGGGQSRSGPVPRSVFPLDLAALQHVRGQGFEDGLLPKREAKRFHVTDEPALPVADRGQRFVHVRGSSGIRASPAAYGCTYSPHILRRFVDGNRRACQVFTALYAEWKALITAGGVVPRMT